jgi:hypothetical protein
MGLGKQTPSDVFSLHQCMDLQEEGVHYAVQVATEEDILVFISYL